MRICESEKLRRAARGLRNRFVGHAVVLLYHRVGHVPSDPQSLWVTPEHFGEHLDILRNYGRPIHLQQLVRCLQDGNLPRRGVVVTFDDGYADNLHNAKPLLERYDIPATVFVTTGYIGRDREFWWDELDRLLLQPGTLPETLCLRVNGTSYQWELGEASHYSEDTYQRYRSWNSMEKNIPTPRQYLYRSLHGLLLPLPEREQRKVLDELMACGGTNPAVRANHRALSRDEVCHLVRGGLVDIGAHTVTHPVLSALPAAAQRYEIQRSKVHLEQILGRSVTGFAYPYGTRSDYTSETIAIVGEAGFACACSNFAAVARRGTDLFQVPRVLVRDWDGEEFARRMGEWFRG